MSIWASCSQEGLQNDVLELQYLYYERDNPTRKTKTKPSSEVTKMASNNYGPDFHIKEALWENAGIPNRYPTFFWSTYWRTIKVLLKLTLRNPNDAPPNKVYVNAIQYFFNLCIERIIRNFKAFRDNDDDIDSIGRWKEDVERSFLQIEKAASRDWTFTHRKQSIQA